MAKQDSTPKSRGSDSPQSIRQGGAEYVDIGPGEVMAKTGDRRITRGLLAGST